MKCSLVAESMPLLLSHRLKLGYTEKRNLYYAVKDNDWFTMFSQICWKNCSFEVEVFWILNCGGY